MALQNALGAKKDYLSDVPGAGVSRQNFASNHKT